MDPNSLILTAITCAEDDDLKSSKGFLDIRDNNCESNKTSAAIKQFNFFLKGYCDEKGYNARVGFDPITKSDEIPYLGLDDPGDAYVGGHDNWWSDLIGNFFNYLAFGAYKYLKKEKGLLMYDSATGYASAIKVHFENMFRGKQPLLVFRDPSWRKLRNVLMTKCKERAKRTGQRITNPKIASNDSDRNAMADACFWLGTAEASEFHGLNVSAYHLIGRGREVSTLKPEDLSLVRVNEELHNHHVISVTLQRDKDGPLQELSIYPHRHSLQEDPYFCLIYSLLVGGCDKSSLFPKFSREANVLNKKEKTASRVASYWQLCFNNLYKEFKSLSETVNDNLTCYHGRKGANQKLAETSSVSGLAQIFRTGWELRGFHTIFDYVLGSKTLTDQAGKALSGWTKEAGGLPPVLSSIRSSPDLVIDFVLVLFSEDIEERWPVSIRNVLTASLLRHYNEFIYVIEQHPTGLWEDNSRHVLVNAVQRALRLAKVPSDTFNLWCKEVRDGFCVNNFMALPIDLLPPDAVRDTKVDPRSLFDRYDSLVSSYNGLFTQKMNLEDDVSRLRLDVAQLTRSNCRLEKAVVVQTEILARVVDVLEVKFDKQTSTPLKASPAGFMLFSDSRKRWRKDFSPKEMFVRYFADQCFDGYELEKNSSDFKSKLPSEKNQIKGQYKRLKHTIKVILYFCDSFPKPIPQDPSGLGTWQRHLSSLAEQAMNALIDEIPDPPNRVTPAYLLKAGIVKDWDNPASLLAKSLPKDTPSVVLAHFGVSV